LASNANHAEPKKEEAASQQIQNQLSSDTINIMRAFNKTTVSMLYQIKSDSADSLINSKPLAILLNCAYTIQCIEQFLSSESKCLFGDFSVKQSNLLSNIVKQAALSSYAIDTASNLNQSLIR
jgi:hypothetical protein